MLEDVTDRKVVDFIAIRDEGAKNNPAVGKAWPRLAFLLWNLYAENGPERLYDLC